MKKNILQYMITLSVLQLLFACTPDDYTYYNNENPDPASIDSVVLKPNHLQLIADGHAQLDLRPVIFNKQGFQFPDSRIKEEWLEYISYSGTKLSRYFSTSDPSLIGQTITTQVKIKGTGVVSQPVSFQVVAPLEEKYTSEITIPVIFHIIQTTEDLEAYGGAYSQEKIELLLQKFNHLFGGTSSINPIGVDTHIRFAMAQYDQYGQKMLTPGIHQLNIQTVDATVITNNFADFLENQHLVWPADKYMNIWLISDRKNLVSDFGNTISADCKPHYFYPGTPTENCPKGIDWEVFPANGTFQAKEAGILYKIQELDVIERELTNNSGTASANNELVYYLGCYFGLLPTCTFDQKKAGTDYCDDTIDYWGSDLDTYNSTWYKEAAGCYFRAENIMDDPLGLHISISKNQCERIRWVLQNCPERSAWKNKFAFTGE